MSLSKRCSVVCDTAQGIRECELELSVESSIGAALALARGILGEAGIDWDQAAVGVYGRLRPREYVPLDGDRIELYRALELDPRSARRARAAGESAGRSVKRRR